MAKGIFAFIVALVLATTAQGQPHPQQALVNKYCVTCHNQRLKTAKLELDKLDVSRPEKDPLVWERAIRKLRGGMMPPPGAPRPAAVDVQALAASLETALDKAAAANPNPGSVRIHRLNRAEYANAIRDLFALDVDMAGAARSLVESEGALFGFVPGAAGTGYASTGTLTPGTTAVTGRGALNAPSVTIDGPFDRTGTPVETPNRRKVFLCRPGLDV